MNQSIIDPMVSVIIPVHDTPDAFLKQCFDSIADQSYGRIEIVLIDDGSVPSTARACDELVADKANATVFHLPPRGVAVARNYGIEHSHGRYIVFVDSDDMLLNGAIGTMVEEIEDEKSDISIFSYRVKDGQSAWDESFFCTGFCLADIDDELRHKLVRSCLIETDISNPSGTTNVGVPWAKIYRRSFLDRHSLEFQPGLKRMQDTVFNMDAFISVNRVSYNSTPVYVYRQSGYSITKKYSPDFDRTAMKLLYCFNRFIDKNDATWLVESVHIKGYKLFIEWLILSACHPNTGKTITQQANSIKVAAYSWAYGYIFDINRESCSSAFEITILSLAKAHLWRTIVMATRARGILKQWIHGRLLQIKRRQHVRR